MDLIILNDGLYSLVPVTKAMLADLVLYTKANCFDLCDILRLKLSTYHDAPFNYHVPHNHSSTGYCGILYLDMKPDSPKTTYIQPWNNQEDRSVLYSPEVKPGDIMIVPQHLWHYTEPNKINFKKRILSFDFVLEPVLF